MEGLRNIMEDAVEYQLNKLLPTMPEVCSCDNCKLDMMSFALNRLSPQYTRTDTGALYQKLNNYQPQNEVEILATVMTAINKIGAHPQHK
ncbi:MAG: late competence development ComFB family protein [Bacteroidales bacterium]|nr:late competence development ComFB family protein [Bacteroidales bacterium]MCM1415547.1 late competence development ComFB family protein [bacterium]MCM1424380.1 late competence development ComFB family protein [bacterium]